MNASNTRVANCRARVYPPNTKLAIRSLGQVHLMFQIKSTFFLVPKIWYITFNWNCSLFSLDIVQHKPCTFTTNKYPYI